MVLALLSGVAMFLYGMLLMGDGLKMVACDKLETFLYKMTNTPLKGVALGAGVTCVIQSSSATTVMVIGFVNSMMMKLRQAISIIMGANIGTSITGWILCLSYIEGSGGWATILSTATISAIVAVVGIVLRIDVYKRQVFCYIYEKYGSVKAPVAAHIAVNLLSVFATPFHLFDWLLQEPMRAGVITVICAAVASSMYLFIQRIEEKPDLPDAGEGSAARV